MGLARRPVGRTWGGAHSGCSPATPARLVEIEELAVQAELGEVAAGPRSVRGAGGSSGTSAGLPAPEVGDVTGISLGSPGTSLVAVRAFATDRGLLPRR